MDINKKIKHLNFNFNKKLGSRFFGNFKSSFSGNGLDFMEHKQYTFGDQLKFIDWKSYSRTSKLYTKVFEEDRENDILFLIDLSSDLEAKFFGENKKNLLEQVFYNLSFSAFKNSDNISVNFYGIKKNIILDYKKGISNIFKSLEIIDNLDKKSIDKNNKFSFILENLVRQNIKNKIIFVITDEVFENENKFIKIVGDKNTFVYINIFDYFENNLTNIDSDIVLSDSKTFLNISLKNKNKIDDYKKIRNLKIVKFKDYLVKNGCYYLNLDTKEDIYKKMFLFFSNSL